MDFIVHVEASDCTPELVAEDIAELLEDAGYQDVRVDLQDWSVFYERSSLNIIYQFFIQIVKICRAASLKWPIW